MTDEAAVTTLDAPPGAQPTEGSGRMFRGLSVVGLALLAFVFRLVLGHSFQVFTGDSTQYEALARNLAAGHGYAFVQSAPYLSSDLRLPAYPAVLALGLVINGSHATILVINALLGAAATVLVYLIARAVDLRHGLAIAAAAIAALYFTTASFAGVAACENLSVPAVLGVVYVVLLRPRQSWWTLFIVGSVLAWTAALTRYELVFFVILAAVLGARRAGLKLLGTIGLVACFAIGPALWVGRNEVQLHRVEYGDSILADQGLFSSINPNLGAPILAQGYALDRQRVVTSAERSHYQAEVVAKMKRYFTHHFSAYASGKVKAAIEYPFAPPIYGLTYGGSVLAISQRLLWSVFLLAEYVCALVGGWRWWSIGKRWNVAALGLFPAFAIVLIPLIDVVQRYWLPAMLVVLPAAVFGALEMPSALRSFDRAMLRRFGRPPSSSGHEDRSTVRAR